MRLTKRTTRTVHPRSCGEHAIIPLIRLLPVLAVHPRSCGEHTTVSGEYLGASRFIPAHAGNTNAGAVTQANIGSSPLMRGTPNTSLAFLLPNRFIPAHAGNTCEGVSPVIRHSRFIPAHAGNTTFGSRVALKVISVHPRSCGEHNHLTAWRFDCPNSVHPRSCGEHVFRCFDSETSCILQRFIPAHAGNTRVCHIDCLCRFIPAHAGRLAI